MPIERSVINKHVSRVYPVYSEIVKTKGAFEGTEEAEECGMARYGADQKSLFFSMQRTLRTHDCLNANTRPSKHGREVLFQDHIQR